MHILYICNPDPCTQAQLQTNETANKHVLQMIISAKHKEQGTAPIL